jgi:hypothetical protein
MQDSDSVLRQAGDVNIEKVLITTRSGVSQEVTPQVIAISYYEDLFSPFITGSLILKESFDLVNLFPFAGEETLELQISTPSLKVGNISGKFYIYKLTDRELIGDRNVVYQLHFISMEAVVDLNKKVSKVFTGAPSDIVKFLATDTFNGLETGKRVQVEQTAKDIKFISNFWSPAKAIHYATNMAVNKNGSPSYVFFENRDGFYFASLDTLYNNDVYAEFIYDKYTRDSTPMGGDAKNPQEDYKRIDHISIPTGFDYMDRLRSGLFSSKIVSFDLTKKQYNVKNFTMFDNFDKQNHLNKYNIASQNSVFKTNSLFINYPRDNANFSGFGDATNYKNEQQRLSLLKAAEANKIELVVPGRCDYTVGQKMKVTLYKVDPTSKTDNDDDTIDNMFSGNYIASAINHYITRDRHECNMELIKDTLLKSIDGTKK